MRRTAISHKFVEFIPETLEEGILYVSIPYATAVHKCCCGCGREVVTPLSPTDWELRFDGETISLDPSIGSWALPCESHYWIRRNRVFWALRWSKEKIEDARAEQRRETDEYYAGNHLRTGEKPSHDQPPEDPCPGLPELKG
jgi:hypothetical protein